MNKKCVLVTGSNGFIGRNLCATISWRDDIILLRYDIDSSENDLDKYLLMADIIFHLAGVNRPKKEADFQDVNAGLTQYICRKLIENKKKTKIILSSSIQASMDNPYGKSKRDAENILKNYSDICKTDCVVYRLKNLFGKWCRPNYNSVTATFCYNIAHDLPIKINDPNTEIELTYIDDVVKAFVEEIDKQNDMGQYTYGEDIVSYKVKLGKLAEIIQSLKMVRTTLILPDVSNPLIRCLYATYLSYLETDDFSYTLKSSSDARGSLAEFIKSPHFGQIFVSTTKPGVVRGNHYHQTKIEKFLVLSGKATISFRHIENDDVIEYEVRGEEFKVLDIPPGYTHSIQNIGDENLITMFWANEIFDPEHPDTMYMNVKNEG